MSECLRIFLCMFHPECLTSYKKNETQMVQFVSDQWFQIYSLYVPLHRYNITVHTFTPFNTNAVSPRQPTFSSCVSCKKCIKSCGQLISNEHQTHNFGSQICKSIWICYNMTCLFQMSVNPIIISWYIITDVWLCTHLK